MIKPIALAQLTESETMTHSKAGERMEWLETWVDSRPPPTEEDLRAEVARRCPRCDWLDAVTEDECFRCGHRFANAPEPISGAPLASLPARNDKAVRLRFIENTLLERANDTPELFLLRRKVTERGLVPGFDKLLALAEVNPELFQHFEHQRDVALKALREMRGTALLADETGLGKTIEAGLIAKELRIRGLVRSALIIVPASLTIQWAEELHEKLGLEARIVRRDADLKDHPDILLTTYAIIRGAGVGATLRKRPWDLLICDEAHYLKNRNTKQYKAVNRIEKKYILLLSATPFHNKLIELKNLLDLLKPGLVGSSRAFNKQYVDSKDPRRPINVHHLKTLLSEVMIRHRRAAVMIRLPPRRACIYHLELHDDERAFYEDISDFIGREVRHLLGAFKGNAPLRLGRMAERSAANRRGVRSYSYVLALIALQRETCSSPRAVIKTLRRMAADLDHPPPVRRQLAALADQAAAIKEPRKAAAVFDVLEQFEGKLIVFCEFLETIAYLGERLTAAGVPHVAFHGGLNATKKKAAIDCFRDEARVMLTSRAGGEGLNIQFCANMINYDLPWNPMSVEQRIGRLHRLGQEREVSVINLSVKDTVEARVLELLTHKIKLFSAVIGEIDLILGSGDDDKGFEQMLRESWIRGKVEGDEEAEFRKLGASIEAAREQYESVKANAAVLDKMNPEPETVTDQRAS